MRPSQPQEGGTPSLSTRSTQTEATRRPPNQARQSALPTPSGSARVTLTHPWRRTPFDRYRGFETPDPPPNPYRHVQQQLGLSEQEFEARIAQDIDELFQEIEDERRQALLETLPYERILSKADCRRMFNPNEPPSGSLFGIFRWAFEIDETSSHSPPPHDDQPSRHPP